MFRVTLQCNQASQLAQGFCSNLLIKFSSKRHPSSLPMDRNDSALCLLPCYNYLRNIQQPQNTPHGFCLVHQPTSLALVAYCHMLNLLDSLRCDVTRAFPPFRLKSRCGFHISVNCLKRGLFQRNKFEYRFLCNFCHLLRGFQSGTCYIFKIW